MKEFIYYLVLLGCPKCDGKMYAFKSNYMIKKGVYRERYYYMCSNYQFQRGQVCNSSFKIRKPDIEPHLIAIIKKLLNEADVIHEVKNQIIDKTGFKSLENEKANYQKQLRFTLDNKKILEIEIDNMSFEVKHREKKIADMNNRLYALYDVIDEIEAKIKDVETKMESIEYGKISLETVIDAIKQFDTLYELMTDVEKKEAISGIVKEIIINEEPVNKNYIKQSNLILMFLIKTHMNLKFLVIV